MEVRDKMRMIKKRAIAILVSVSIILAGVLQSECDFDTVSADEAETVPASINNTTRAALARGDIPNGYRTYEVSDEGSTAENVWDGTTDISWYDDEKTEFFIQSPEQLAGLAELVNQGNSFAGKEIILENDIYLNDAPLSNEKEWVSIAKCEDRQDRQYSFEGTFFGNGHVIYNIYLTETGGGGLFGRIGSSGVVNAVTVSQGIANRGGVIAYCNEGIIQYCCNQSIVGNAEEFATGGICNYNYNLVYGCENSGEVWGSFAGGIVGSNAESSATVNQCRNVGKVAGSGEVAGIAAYNYGWLYNSYNIGIVSDALDGVNQARALSGIVSNNSAYTKNCYSACAFDYLDAWYGVDAICNSGTTSGCYYYSKSEHSDSADRVELDEIYSETFVAKLYPAENNIVYSWQADTEYINSGYPIVDADLRRKEKDFRRQQEIWIDLNQFEGKEGTEITRGIQCFLGDAKPQIYLDNQELGSVDYDGDSSGGMITLLCQKAGSGKLYIEIPETKNVVGYRLCIDVNVAAKEEGPAASQSPIETQSPDLPSEDEKDQSDHFTDTTGKQDQIKPLPKKTVSLQRKPTKVKWLGKKTGKRKIIVRWKKVKDAKGYQLQYAYHKKFKKSKKTYTQKSVFTIKKLKKKKTCYIRVRAYKMNGMKKVYGKWSTVKKVRIKK